MTRSRIKPMGIDSLNDYLGWVSKHCKHREAFFRGQPFDELLLPKIARLSSAHSVLEIEKQMFRQFKRQLRAFVNNLPKRDLEILALARHHGLPTRLLDWTSNPLTALWFAIKSVTEKNNNAEVWA